MTGLYCARGLLGRLLLRSRRLRYGLVGVLPAFVRS